MKSLYDFSRSVAIFPLYSWILTRSSFQGFQNDHELNSLLELLGQQWNSSDCIYFSMVYLINRQVRT